MIACLNQHQAELSPVCREKVDKAMAKLEQAKHDCAPDIASYCAGVTPGGGRLLHCLKKQIDHLSPACRAQVEHYAAKPAAAK